MAKKIRIILANNSQETLASLRSLLEQCKEFKVTAEAKNGKDAVDMALEFQPDIVIMSVNLPRGDGYECAKKIVQAAPYIGVILTGTAENLQIIRNSMQVGASDFLAMPVSKARLQESITNLFNIKQQQKKHFIDYPISVPRREPKVIAVFSSKGGVGKTVISTNIAVALKELTHEDVLLIDLDLQFGDVADLLNITPKISIKNLVEDKINLESNEIDKYLIPHESGIQILAAPEKPEDADLIEVNDIKDLMQLFKKSFDYIVIDLPPLFNQVTLGAIELADHVFLVSTMEIPTLRNIKGGLEILRRLEYPEGKITLIVNRFDARREINGSDINKFLNVSEIYYIDDNPELVSSSINLGEPIVSRNKETPVARQIINLAKTLIDYMTKPPVRKRQNIFKHFLAKRGWSK